jgi:YHS domain-containing protein
VFDSEGARRYSMWVTLRPDAGQVVDLWRPCRLFGAVHNEEVYMNARYCTRGAAYVLACTFAWAIGCEKQTPPTQPPADPGAKVEVTPEERADIEARLVKADALDGKSDKLIVKCALCGYGMDGKAEHASRHGDYRMQFCSAGCKTTFDKDPAKAIKAASKS